MYAYYEYAPDEFFLFYLMLMTLFIGTLSEDPVKWFVDALGKRLHVNFLGYSNWFMSIIIYQIKDNSISVDQSIYATSIVEKYLDTSTVKTITKFYKTTFQYDTIFTKSDAYTRDEQVEKLNREFNVFYRASIG